MEMDTDMDRGMERFRRLSVAADIVGQLFLDEPSPEMLTALTNPDLLKDWPLQDPDSREATAMLERSAAQPDTVEQLQRDHLYLFIGTGAPLAQPYESPYFSLDGLVLDGGDVPSRSFLRNRWLPTCFEHWRVGEQVGEPAA